MENTNKVNFESAIANNRLVLVDFYANWCGPCKMMAPIIEELNKELAGKVKVLKVDVDQENELSRKYQITAIPTLILIKDGQVVSKTMGYKPKDAILAIIKNYA
ncbi:MAG TPA: thioredoxin [Bacilli bacterium]|nr:MAG: Thioredoxin [Tenericutes bacterium ADurb.BinA124]HNZ50995.1 thioredoxin [Bacilli bacterium]HOH18052.1 thioredoxin [Bacilli bacterium]HPN61194.1 thioredoxin [Bacilli bacterium]HPX83891.1 thioredoxin [Bacilli bacterium]